MMPAWSLSGLILVALTAPAAGDRAASRSPARTAMRIVDVAANRSYQLPVVRHVATVVATPDFPAATVDQRYRTPAPARRAIHDPQADSVRTLLRDRLARRGGALDARVEWRLTGNGSDVGLGGGLKRVVDTLLHD